MFKSYHVLRRAVPIFLKNIGYGVLATFAALLVIVGGVGVILLIGMTIGELYQLIGEWVYAAIFALLIFGIFVTLAINQSVNEYRTKYKSKEREQP